MNFSEILIKGKEVEFELAGNSSFIRVRGNRVKMTETWGERQGKWDIVRVSVVSLAAIFWMSRNAPQKTAARETRVSGEFALSEFEVSWFFCIYVYNQTKQANEQNRQWQ